MPGSTAVALHDLRHAYGSRLASKGLSARQIADAMGHKKTWTIYIQPFNGEAADERVPEAMSGQLVPDSVPKPSTRHEPQRPAPKKTRRLLRVFSWARLGSNQRPPACEAGALPLSYAPGSASG
jgi:hypothetical protein